jgi:hypothetical protein
MKKRTFILIMALVLILLFLSMTAVSAQPNKPMECVVDAAFDPGVDPQCWHGMVSGCPIAGEVTICENPAIFPGKTEHFFEEFTIHTGQGDIYGIDAGVWNFATFKFRANGWVTSATGDWAYLVGYKLHEMGTSSNPDDGFPVTITNAEMTLHQP